MSTSITEALNRLIHVRMVGVQFTVPSADSNPDEQPKMLLRICNINGDRHVVANDIPYCHLRQADWAKPRIVRVYSITDRKMLSLIPLHVIQQNRHRLYRSIPRFPNGSVALFDRALQAAAIDRIPSAYNHLFTPSQLLTSRQAQFLIDDVLHRHCPSYLSSRRTPTSSPHPSVATSPHPSVATPPVTTTPAPSPQPPLTRWHALLSLLRPLKSFVQRCLSSLVRYHVES